MYIMDLEATKRRAIFNTCGVIAPQNVYLDGDSIIKAIGMGSTVMKTI